MSRWSEASTFGFELHFVRAPSSAESLDIGRQDTFRNPFRFDTSRNPLTPRRIDCGELHGSAVRTESGVWIVCLLIVVSC